jgi:hypothetical protein
MTWTGRFWLRELVSADFTGAHWRTLKLSSGGLLSENLPRPAKKPPCCSGFVRSDSFLIQFPVGERQAESVSVKRAGAFSLGLPKKADEVALLAGSPATATRQFFEFIQQIRKILDEVKHFAGKVIIQPGGCQRIKAQRPFGSQ